MALNNASLDALETALHELSTASRRRGQEYFRAGRVKVAIASGTEISAHVHGTETYLTEWLRDDEGYWSSLCSCPVGGDCKHAAALALHFLALHRLARATPVPAPPPAKKPATTSLAKAAEKALGRKLTELEKSFAREIDTLHRRVRREHRAGILASELRRLSLADAPRRSWEDDLLLRDWWDDAPPTATDLWQYLAYHAEQTGRPTPDFLDPITDVSAVRARRRDQEIAEWTATLLRASPATPPPATRLRLRVSLAAFQWESSADGTLWRRASADQVRNLALQQQQELDGDSATHLLLTLARQTALNGYGERINYALKPDRAEDRALLGAALHHPVCHPALVGEGGEPLRISPERIVWRFAADPATPDDLTPTLAHADGRPFDEPHLVLPGRRPWLLTRTAVFPAPPPLVPKDDHGKPSSPPRRIPREALARSADVLATLARQGALLPADLGGRVVRVALRPRLRCEILPVPIFGGNERLALELQAVDDTWGEVQSWSGSAGWTRKSSPPARPAGPEDPVPSFDPSAAAALIPRLDALQLERARGGSSGSTWSRALTRPFAEDFAAWARALPPGLEILATAEARAFFQPAPAARVDISIAENPHRPDWFDLKLDLRTDDLELTREETRALLAARGKFIRLPSGRWGRLERADDPADVALLAALGLDDHAAGERLGYHALQLADIDFGARADAALVERLRERAARLHALPPPAPPAGLRGDLRPYQRDGFHFLAFLAANGLGGILADDMGLGKTIQALAWLLWLRARKLETDAAAPFHALVVCPKSVVFNWEAEGARFAPDLPVQAFTPALAAVTAPLAPGLVVANYTQLRLHDAWFFAQQWDATLLDEGQFIKNPDSRAARVARELPTAHRALLTGTPVENRPLDLWSLFAFAQPGLLGPQATFKRLYENVATPEPLAALQGRVRHFMLRRTKAQVASDLPERIEEDLLVALEGDQAHLYQAELKRARQFALGLADETAFDQSRFHVLRSLLRLRQICCDPRIGAHGSKAATASASAKLAALLERLPSLVAEGHKILVFSQFVEMLELIAAALRAEGIGHLLLTGRTADRAAVVERFQTSAEFPVFLLSLKAAGSGLNLTAASYVFLYDPWWNPAVEAQAIDRTHRIGQKNPVIAYRLLAHGTIEEKIRALQRRKGALSDALVRAESLGGLLDLASLRELLAP